jgi:CDP-glycerol glycerophosphotransferase (TagB/SpsB family)
MGIPFKRIGKLAGEIGRDDTYLVATSEFTRGVFSKSFGTHEKNIIITGQPRTDRMLSVNKAEVLRRIFPYGPLPDYVLLWLPTYRRTAYSKSQCDGDFYDNIFNCTSFSTSIFNSILSKNNAVCLVKPHPMSVKQSITDESNLYFIDEHWLHERRLSLYELIGATDCLISDISSVIADYMLLDNPIILLFEDIASYENSRGFSFSPITRYLPAKVNRNFDSFIVELENVLSGQDVYEERRAELKRLFFDFSDASAANRILDITMGGVSITK